MELRTGGQSELELSWGSGREPTYCALRFRLPFLPLCTGNTTGVSDSRFSHSTPKTKERMASVPIIDQVRVPLELWRAKCDNPHGENWVFADLPNMLNRVIKPHVMGENSPAKTAQLRQCERCEKTPKTSGVKWAGLYAGRRGACTAVIEATNGNYAVAQALLRHKKMTTTLNVYKKQITPDAYKAGMKLFQKALTEKK